MPVIPIDDATDLRLREYVALRDVQLRTSLEAREGIFIAEGEKVIRRALAAGYRPRSLLLAARWLESLQDVLDTHKVPIYVVSEALAEEVTGFHVHRGALGAFERQARYSVDDLLTMRRIVVAEDIVDHTNVGAILRSAAGLGWDGCLLAPRAADPLYRRAIKVSMGATFTLPWARLDDHYTAIATLKAADFLVAALALTDQAIELAELCDQVRGTDQKVALLVGTEGAGLSGRWLAEADVHAIIPMAAGIDSLNVAAATAVACYSIGGFVTA